MTMTNGITSGLLASLPGRYAKVLFALSEEHAIADQISIQLKKLIEIIDRSTELKKILKNPGIKREEQAAVLVEICKKTQSHDLLCQFLKRLCLARRLSYLKNISDLFDHQLATQKGEKEISVISYTALSELQKKKLIDDLSKIYTEKLKPIFTIDPHILGGFIVRIDNQVIDASLTTQLNRLATVMKGHA